MRSRDLSAPGAAPVREAPGRSGAQPAALRRESAPQLPGIVETAAAPAPRSRKRRVLLLVALCVAGAALYFGYGWWTNGRFIVATDDAYVQADITILAAKATGYVASVEVENNQPVEAGQVIARLDDVDYRLAIRSADDKLATQRSAVERIGRQIDAAAAQVAQARPLIDAAAADVERTIADYDRQTRLSQSDFASRARLEQSKADRDRGAANLKGAQAGLVAAQANVEVLRAQRQEAERGVSEAQTMLAKAERDLSFTVIRAPMAGTLGNRAIEIGAYVQPGTRLAALVPLSGVHVDANFKETQLGAIKSGQVVRIEVDAFGGREVAGTVESIAPASGAMFSLLPPENATGNFTKIVQRVPVRIKVDPEQVREGILRPGLSVTVRIDSRERPAATSGR